MCIRDRQGTTQYGLWYPKGKRFTLTAYTDADWASCVDDIIFGSNKDELAKGFAEEMKSEFEMSMIGELSFYLGLQIQQKNTSTFISQEKYSKEMLKKFKMEECKPVTTPMITG